MASLLSLVSQVPILQGILPYLTSSDVGNLACTNSQIYPFLVGRINPQTRRHSIEQFLISCNQRVRDPITLQRRPCGRQRGVHYCRTSRIVTEPELHALLGNNIATHYLCTNCQQATHASCNPNDSERVDFMRGSMMPLCNDCCVEEELAQTVHQGDLRFTHHCITRISGRPGGEWFLCRRHRERIANLMADEGRDTKYIIRRRGRNADGEWKRKKAYYETCPCGKSCSARELAVPQSTMRVCLLCDAACYTPNLPSPPRLPRSARLREKILDEYRRFGLRRNREVLKMTPALARKERRRPRG